MSLTLRLCALSTLILVAGCSKLPRAQRGGGSTTTLGGGTAPTTVESTAPENPQTPTTTTIEKTTSREFFPIQIPNNLTAENAKGTEKNRAVPVSASSVFSAVVPVRESVTERATTQTGSSQDLAGIMKAWGTATAAHYKSILWALALGVAAWRAWQREWPLIAAVLAIGAILSLLVAWWVGPVAAGAAGLVWAAYHVARAQIPTP